MAFLVLLDFHCPKDEYIFFVFKKRIWGAWMDVRGRVCMDDFKYESCCATAAQASICLLIAPSFFFLLFTSEGFISLARGSAEGKERFVFVRTVKSPE